MAHTKYESNPADWQRVVEIGWHLLTRQDTERFEKMCEDGLLGRGRLNVHCHRSYYSNWIRFFHVFRVLTGLLCTDSMYSRVPGDQGFFSHLANFFFGARFCTN